MRAMLRRRCAKPISRPTTAVVVTDLYTFALPSGAVLRYSGWTTPLTIPGTAFPVGSLNYNADRLHQLRARAALRPLEGDDQDRRRADRARHLDPGRGRRSGRRDRVLPRRCGSGSSTARRSSSTGFSRRRQPAGRARSTPASARSCGSTAASPRPMSGAAGSTMKVKSLMNLLAVQQMPRRLYQAACTHVFGDAMCGFNRASLAATVSGRRRLDPGADRDVGLSPSPATLYDQGTIMAISGANAGQRRTIAQLVGRRWRICSRRGCSRSRSATRSNCCRAATTPSRPARARSTTCAISAGFPTSRHPSWRCERGCARGGGRRDRDAGSDAARPYSS